MQDPNYPELIASDAGDFRPAGIRNLTPGLVERGKIKIGQKGGVRKSAQGGKEFQLPQKLDHFIVTSMERGADNNFVKDATVMQMLGDTPREIPISLVYDDINLNFPSRYACYAGKTLWCTGDGQQARRANVDDKGQIGAGHHLVQCPCHRQAPDYTGKDKCKITGTLSAVIEGADVVGGVWKFRTTSYNSVVGILSSLAMIQRITGGRLAGIPLTMKLSPKAVTDPVNGGQQTVYVVSIEYRGSIQALRAAGYQALKDDREHGARIELLEDQARALLADRRDEYEVDADEVVDEFYPDQSKAAAVADGVVVKQRSFQEVADDTKAAQKPDAPPADDPQAKAEPVKQTQKRAAQAQPDNDNRPEGGAGAEPQNTQAEPADNAQAGSGPGDGNLF